MSTDYRRFEGMHNAHVDLSAFTIHWVYPSPTSSKYSKYWRRTTHKEWTTNLFVLQLIGIVVKVICSDTPNHDIYKLPSHIKPAPNIQFNHTSVTSTTLRSTPDQLFSPGSRSQESWQQHPSCNPHAPCRRTSARPFLVGSFDPFDKYSSKWVHLPQFFGVKIPKNLWNHWNHRPQFPKDSILSSATLFLKSSEPRNFLLNS